MGFIALIAALAGVAAAQTSIRLTRSPRKTAILYSLEDSRVPSGLARSTARRVTATDGAVWEATGRGLWRIEAKAPEADRRQYFAGRRYLADDDVAALEPDSSRGVWARTRTGVSHIEMQLMTLAEKARVFEERVAARHDRHGLVASSRLLRPGDLSSNQTVSSDNDGLWTAMYAAAECFRFAVTKSPEALARARRSIEAVLFLEQVTGVAGLPARSILKTGEPQPGDGVWHRAPDGQHLWKADTSSDEIVGHYFLFSVAWDLLPPDDPLRRRIADTTRRITDHIIAAGWLLLDLHGQPTYWGRWSPDYFATPRGLPDGPLNAVELLSLLATARHITGDAHYGAAYRKAALEMGYAALAARLNELRRTINYSDEELAMLAFYPLLEYEKDAALLGHYRRALDQWWENMRREKNPLWTIIYLRGRRDANADVEGALWTLRRIPMDLVDWAVRNLDRQDVTMAPAVDRFGRGQSLTLLAPDERPVMKWNGNPFRVDGGGNGSSEDDGAFFLLPYWMGRHHRVWIGE